MTSASVSALPHPVRSWIEPVARLGFAAKGTVYIVIGVLAVKSALGRPGGKAADTHGAIRAMGNQPLGDFVLLAVGVGLLAYAAWRVIQGLLDADHKGSGPKGLSIRAAFLGSGVVHAGLAVTALAMAMGEGAHRSDGIEHWTARALAQPFGQWGVALAGAGVMAAGFYQFFKAWKASFEKRLALERVSASGRRWIRRIGRAGLSARGVTFGIMGWFLIQAALHADAREARGLAGSLRLLRRQEQGDLILGAVGLGLAAYGVHALVMARYRRLPR